MRLLDFSVRVALVGSLGYLVGKGLTTNPKLSALVWVIGEVARQFFLQKIQYHEILNENDRFPAISLLIGGGLCLAMRQLSLITGIGRSVLIVGLFFVSQAGIQGLLEGLRITPIIPN